MGEVPPKPSATPSLWALLREPEDEPTDPGEPERPSRPQAPPNCALKFDPQSVYWSMRNLPIREAPKHFLVCGATGSGKTIAIQLFLQSIAPRFRDRVLEEGERPEQLILFDAKSDVMPVLDLLGLGTQEENVWLLNPYDARSAVWNLAEAVQTPVMARALATLLVPEEKQSTAPYFSDAARELVYAVLLGLNRVAGATWTFRDLLCALDSRAHIAAVSAQDLRAEVLANRILHDERHSDGVLSTLGTKLGHFEQVAALWYTNTTGRTFSIQDFLKRPGVLVLGNDPVLRSSFWPINAILLKALSQEILRGPNTLDPRHWFILDEFRAMERIDCIHDLLNRGRSKGVSILVGIQSVEGLMEIYGQFSTDDLLSQCATKMFLRAGGSTTAAWAEKHFSKIRHIEETVTETTGTGTWSTSIQRALQERSLFLPSFFLDLPFPGPGEPYIAVCDVPVLRETIIVERAFDDVIQWCRQPPDDAAVPAVVAREDTNDQMLLPWTDDEEAKFQPAPQSQSTQPNGGPQLPGRVEL